MGKAVGKSSAALARVALWPAFELRVRHGWSAPPAAACAVAQAPGPVPSARTLYRFAARIFLEWIRAKGIKLADVQIAWLRRRHLIPSWYDCACQDKTRCPGLPPSAKFGPRKASSTPSRCSVPKESGKSLSSARHSEAGSHSLPAAGQSSRTVTALRVSQVLRRPPAQRSQARRNADAL